MQFRFAAPKLEELAHCKRLLQLEFGDKVAAKICQRLFELAACDCWQTVVSLPHLAMVRDRAVGSFVIPILQSHRICLEPLPANQSRKGSLLSSKVVRVVAIEAIR